MINSYLKTAWRNMRRNKLSAFINVFGLAISLSCTLVIWLWISDETSYNKFLKRADDIYEVHVNAPFNGDTVTMTACPGPLAEALQRAVPQIEQATKMTAERELLFSVGDQTFKEKGSFASDGFFKVFPVKTMESDANRALASIDQVVITQKLSEKYFHGSGAVGKIIKVNNKKDFIVGAVVEDFPHNSTIQVDWLINFKVQQQDWMEQWGNISFPTYVRLKPNVDLATTANSLRSIYPRFASQGFLANFPSLQPITDVRLYADFKNGKPTGSGRIVYVKIFAGIAMLILLIACMNFMNLATARASLRAKEIGVRKVSGAGKASLVMQFMIESVLTCVLATLLSLIITWVTLPAFNALFEKEIHLDLLQPALWGSISALVVITSIIAGSYPSFFLASLQSIRVLKGDVGIQGNSVSSVRKGLVVVQFALSAFLMVGMLAVSKQVNYIQKKNPGFDKQHIVYVPLEGNFPDKVERYQNALSQLPDVVASSPVNQLPMDINSTSGDLDWPGKPANLQTEVVATSVGYGFTKTLDLPLAEGRDFSKQYPGDSSNYLVNEAAVKLMGMQGDAVGKEITFWRGKGRVVGIMKDFHIASLHDAIKPLVLCLQPTNTSFLMIRLRSGRIKEAIAAIGKVTKIFKPEYPFEYHFADEVYGRMYNSEMQVNALVRYFGILALVISCLGLFGMIAFSAERRAKEIGIRRVLGSSVAGIVKLLSAESLRIIIIAMAIAFPLAYWAVNEWMRSFAYQSPGSTGIFIFAAVIMLIVSFVTIGFQAMKAALANPVTSLRCE